MDIIASLEWDFEVDMRGRTHVSGAYTPQWADGRPACEECWLKSPKILNGTTWTAYLSLIRPVGGRGCPHGGDR